ncbi:alpha/beta fold hydrolase [Nonomuraea insulae]|uniref:Alpha/beta fold hydrolase n=1 Tax=Nonomuraea insulae TaxID=1616787 RepID=A0ABW1CN45_9ACTN
MDTALTINGSDIRVYEQGRGPAVLLIGPGLDDGRRVGKIAAILGRRFRALRLHRRQYRLDLKTGGSRSSVSQEVADVLAIAHQVGRPLIVYGHSSGGVVALEALVAEPSAFDGAVIFEPAVLAGVGGETIRRARAAFAAGKPGKAMAVFTQDAVGLPAWQARPVGVLTALVPHYRRLVPGQLDDLEAMVELGDRLDAYASIAVPTVLLSGDRSPARVTAMIDSVARAMPHAERVVMPKRDHGADLKAPDSVARVIQTFADRISA